MGRITSTPGPHGPASIGTSPDAQTSGHTAPASQPLPVGRRSPLQSDLRTRLAQAPRTSAPPLPQLSAALPPLSGDKQTPPREIAAPGADEASSPRSAPAAAAAQLKQAVVLDWDDCLRYEKGVNYQLMHNALSIAAQMHAQNLPELKEAVDRLRGRMERGEPAGDSDPLIMRSLEDCSNYLAAHHIYRRDLVNDFVRKMLPDVDSSKAATITTAVYTQCVREYNRMVTDPKQRQSRPCEVPFPDLEITLMPGARELLSANRAKGSPVMLVSNRAHYELKKEVDHLDMRQDFDVVSGAPTVTLPRPNASAEPMPDALQEQLTSALRGDDDKDDDALRMALEDASAYAHPNTTVVTQIDRKPNATRLLDSLQRLSVPPEAPIVLYGDQPQDISQAAEFAKTGRIKGVLVDPNHPDVGRQIDIKGIPTRVIGSLTDLNDLNDPNAP
ncbi:hypothetical protein ACQUJT_12700 [Ralstonia pseudosolanacearum]